jgi:hypothetical protein
VLPVPTVCVKILSKLKEVVSKSDPFNFNAPTTLHLSKVNLSVD